MHLLRVIAALGAAQGVLLLLAVCCRYPYRKNLPFALLLVLFSIRVGTIPMWTPETLLTHPWYLPLIGPLPMLFGPLVWWYAREIAPHRPSRPRKIALHAIPYAVEAVGVALIIGMMSRPAYSAFVEGVFAGHVPLWMLLRHGAKVASGLFYGAAAGKVLFTALIGHPAARLDSAPAAIAGPRAEARTRRDAKAGSLWLCLVVAGPFVAMVLFALVAFRPESSVSFAHGVASTFLPLTLGITLLVYCYSVLFLVAPEPLEEAVPGDKPITGFESRLPVSPHSRCIDRVECLRLASRLSTHLAAGAYQDPALSLSALAERLHTRPNRLSYAVNRVLGYSLPGLVNHYRLTHFLRYAREGALAKQSILELALEAGFPAKSTFNRVFKRELGMPPSAYAARFCSGNGSEPNASRDAIATGDSIAPGEPVLTRPTPGAIAPGRSSPGGKVARVPHRRLQS